MTGTRKIALLILCAVFVLLMFGCGASDTDAVVTEAMPEVIHEITVLPADTMVTNPVIVEIPTEPEPSEEIAKNEPVDFAPVKLAQQITENYQIRIDGYSCNLDLADDNYWTKRYIKPEQKLSIVSDEAFSSVYLEWDQIPGEYILLWENGQMKCGAMGFFHEYVTLPEPVNSVEFLFEADVSRVLCDADIFTDGIAPDHVQAWLPPCDDADILVFPTHSDDDVLFFGPLMSYYALEHGLTVQSAFMVEHRGSPERNHERLNGLWELGIRHYPILGTAPDTSEAELYFALRYYKDINIEQWQVEQIRRFRPLVVVGHDIDGEYGNGGHKVNTHYLITAVEAAADALMYPDSAEAFGVWDTPKFYLHLYPENEIILDVNIPMSADPLNRTPFQVAEEAFQCHLSQHHYGFRVQQGEWRATDCRPFGLYRSLVGLDQNAEIMENIDPADWR